MSRRRFLGVLGIGGASAVTLTPLESKAFEINRIRAYPSSSMPDRIVLTWMGDPATSQAVTWRTNADILTPVAEIAEADGSPTFVEFPYTYTPSSYKLRQIGWTDFLPSSKFRISFPRDSL